MNAYTVKKDTTSDKIIVADDMLLTTDMPTTAGSKMLDGYMSLFDATVVEKLTEAGMEYVRAAEQIQEIENEVENGPLGQLIERIEAENNYDDGNAYVDDYAA